MPLVANRYEILRPLGSGGMADVVAAHDTRLGRDVAIKLIRSAQLEDPSSRERLLREARAAGALHHPNTVAVYDVGEDDDPYIVMELVEGETLEARLRRGTPLSVEEAVAIGLALLDALQAAHAQGLVHRDLKPSNVLLSTAGAIKLADFGIAKAADTTDPGLTMTGQVLGTPRYLSPEQAAGQPATPASDLYSLGAVLYECVAGRPPFDGPSAIAIALAHQRSPVPPLLEEAPQVPAAVAATIERALRKDPQERFAGAAQMRRSLQGGPASEGPGAAHGLLPGGGAGVSTSEDGVAATTRRLDAQPTEAWPGAGDGPVSGGERSPRVGWWWLAAALAAVVLLAAVALPRLLTSADGPADQAGDAVAPPEEPADDEAEGAVGDEDDEPPEEPGEDPDPEPTPDTVSGSLDELIGDLARDPDAAGQQAHRLLRGLMDLRDESDEGDRRQDARDLIMEISSWLARSHLAPDTAAAAVGVLEPIGRPDAPELAEVSALFAAIALETEAWGRKAGDLMDDLDDLLGADPGDRAEDAVELIEELEEWIEGGELDPDRGRRAQEVLAPLASTAG